MDILPIELFNKISKNILNFQTLIILKKTCKTFNKIITKINIKIAIFNIIYKKSISKNRNMINVCINSECGIFTWRPCGFNNKFNLYNPYCYRCAHQYCFIFNN
tara:strand:+ start:781 stop:1092 length:312 start_codon:yes stop_codon:yes gene_type:complete